MKKQYYCFSFSFGILAILDGTIDESQVLMIVSSTNFTSPEQAVKEYASMYWRKYNPEYILELVTELWNEGKIVQPRSFNAGFRGHSICKGCWMNVENQEFSKQPE